MKKLLFIFCGFFLFACNNTDNKQETDRIETTTDESVEIGSGEEISPQLEEGESDDLLEVDTISAPPATNRNNTP